MRYLAALDYAHLDNGVFLTSLARSLSQQQNNRDLRSIIVHTDSAYTDRIIQTGVMREEATVRSLKDLNKRLVALFADQGVSTIGLNPYRRNFITLRDDQLALDHSFLERLPTEPVLLFSTLVQDLTRGQQVGIALPRMLRFLEDELKPDEVFFFTKSDESEVLTSTDHPDTMQWSTMDSSFREKQIPDELTSFDRPVRLSTARDFHHLPKTDHTILIK
ncbi:hypothetical protein [Fodinibius sediminis]|uniref:Uncharacterized protein n=1 Tax=Fodinibius sediminis TaxID=1214077 RepID=A0A521CZK1_9BACT|nr:hypothetical protein [Fodinibius sediminis]SMO64866.1 hypothetical protein SAMN06265218_10849 [Fodinibius sediminis]